MQIFRWHNIRGYALHTILVYIRTNILKIEKKKKVRFQSDTSVYAGEFWNDKPHGKGKVIYVNGNVYEGGMVEDKRHGWGRMTSRAGIYSGDWVITLKT